MPPDSSNQTSQTIVNFLETKPKSYILSPELKAILATDAERSVWYAMRTGLRFEEAESLISTSPELSYLYAKNVVKERWAEGEPAILRLADICVSYAMFVVKGGWSEGEEKITTAGSTTYEYACLVIRDSFLDADIKAIKYPDRFSKYIKYNRGFLRSMSAGDICQHIQQFPNSGRDLFLTLPQSTQKWIQDKMFEEPMGITTFCVNFIHGRSCSGEAALLEFGDPKDIFTYARDVIKGRWIQAEHLIATNPYIVGKYVQMIYDRYVDHAIYMGAGNPRVESSYVALCADIKEKEVAEARRIDDLAAAKERARLEIIRLRDKHQYVMNLRKRFSI